VIAASYYAVALIAYMIKGVKAVGKGEVADMAIGLATPLVIITIFLLVSRIRHRYVRETEDAASRSTKTRARNDTKKGL